jgi:4-alpha-glucanotransferase
MNRNSGRRRAGVVVPLFSCPSTSSWGVGESADLVPFSAWLVGAGLRVLQLLPLNEMAEGQQSPYSATSAMAIDPLFIAPSTVPELSSLGGEACLGAEERRSLAAARQAQRVEYEIVRQLKRLAFRAAFERFIDAEWNRDTARAQELKAYVRSQSWWIDDYALFRAVHDREGGRAWTDWPDGVRNRAPAAMNDARRELSRRILFYQYLQWIADTGWRHARREANRGGLAIFGDLSFMVDLDSADVWARPHQFRLDASVGVPPDAFSPDGQDWGMPVYRWDAMADDDFRWLRLRARRNADLFDGYRVDHLVGFYRTYGRPHGGGKPFFTPGAEADQVRLGEKVLEILGEAGAEIIAEDLGTVPDFVRESLARMRIPGFCVLRWERNWEIEGQPFRDPADYPARSVATTGTHDTEALATWWTRAPDEERQAVSDLATVRMAAGGSLPAKAPYTPVVRDALIESIYAARSELSLIPLPDVFGSPVRINAPATVDDHNWTFRLDWPVDRLDETPEAKEAQARLRSLAERHLRF